MDRSISSPSSRSPCTSTSTTTTAGVKNSGEGSFVIHYLGATMMDSHFNYTDCMMPWLVAEILRFTEDLQALLMIKNHHIMANCAKTGRKLFEAHVWDYLRDFAIITADDKGGPHSPGGRFYFVIIFKTNDIYLHCRLLSASSQSQVREIIATMKESAKECSRSSIRSSPAATTGSRHLNDLTSLNDSLSFEVFYMGKLRMSTRRAPPTFIDEALDKFKSHEMDAKHKQQHGPMLLESERTSSQESSELGSTDSLSGGGHPAIQLTTTTDEGSRAGGPDKENRHNRSSPIVPVKSASASSATFAHPLEDVISPLAAIQRPRHPSGGDCLVKSLSLPVEPMRSRAFSTGHESQSQSQSQSRGGGGGSGMDSNRQGNNLSSNRTMILIVGKSEIRIISPDAKTVLFSKGFCDICHISKGVQNKDCFGFICVESERISNTYVSYIFRCESDSVSTEVLRVLRQALIVTQENLKKEARSSICDHCPMQFFATLCTELEGLPDDRVLSTIVKRVESLPETERQNILTKFQGAQPQSITEQNELYMMLLRAYCESKQGKHTHDTTENRHEFLNQYLGGGAILMKAKRSLTNSFDQLLKKKGNQPPPPSIHQPQHTIRSAQSIDRPSSPSESMSMVVSDSPLTPANRQRSLTLGALSNEKVRVDNMRLRSAKDSGGGLLRSPHHSPNSLATSELYTLTPQRSASQQGPHSPIMNIFMKSASKSLPTAGGSSQQPVTMVRRQGWRQAIFKRVVSPQAERHSPLLDGLLSSTPVSSKLVHFRPKRSRAEIRDLWKTAIRQQILLIRMEKQNFMLKAKQEEVTVKRNKLNYMELGNCDDEAADTWDLIISQTQAHSTTKCDVQILSSALLRGVPKCKRGLVWQLFIQQSKVGKDKDSARPNCLVNQAISYEALLRMLTSHQHAILIDLGRTFPSHGYFSGPLGSGQLALFNLLKAYSLLDPDVGYCQGLSFVAGLLLMHLDEDEAFAALKYLMFELGGREHYKADMLGLQIKMYQLTRLIHDQDSDIHLLLYHNDVLPTLYAAPWFLTIFSSQFPIGFAVRILDAVFLHGFEVMVPFALALILDRKQQLLECSGLESVMECFKNVVTQVTSSALDRYLKKVLEMDWEKQLLTYAVEYSVMHDDTFQAFLNQNDAAAAAAASAPATNTKASLFKSSVPVIREENGESQPSEGSGAGYAVAVARLQEDSRLLLQHVELLETLLVQNSLRVPQRPTIAATTICDKSQSTIHANVNLNLINNNNNIASSDITSPNNNNGGAATCKRTVNKNSLK